VLLVSAPIIGQEYHPQRVLVQLQPGVTRQEFSTVMDRQKYAIEKVLVRRLNIVSLRLQSPALTPVAAVADLRRNPWVKHAQLDHRLTRRQTFPDDPQFPSQWNLHNTGQTGGAFDADIDAPEAWDLSSGGVTPLGDTIVVAVVDGGCLITHPDLALNIWTNWGEIPDNGIDDDENGYIDDVHGWNAYDSNGNIPVDGHGTHVSGIVGARGNNGNQVTGVNWSVKIMPIGGSTSQTSVVLEAYGYALDQRILYDSTNGEKGAFIVATNSSFGIDYADCNSGNYPLWNELYTALGEAGILSAAATMNNSSNVDVTGDVPTSCDSDYLVTVTNTTQFDIRNSGAAYGPTTIDLGAPGTAILSTYLSNGTSVLTGTSMASPHVAGAVGFLHSVMSHGFAAFYKNQPGEGALLLKQLLLAGVDSLASLEGMTVSGGRLNLYNTSLLVAEYLAADSLDPNPVTNLSADTTQQFYVVLTWEDPATLVNGDSIPDFVIDIDRNDTRLTSVGQGTETYVDGPLPGHTVAQYSLVTRLVENDSTSIPVSVTVTIAGGECVPGDATHNGIVDVTDIIRILQFVLGYDVPDTWDLCTADVDHDQILTVMDVLLTADIILGRP
jgi:subtilisin family serine protease